MWCTNIRLFFSYFKISFSILTILASGGRYKAKAFSIYHIDIYIHIPDQLDEVVIIT